MKLDDLLQELKEANLPQGVPALPPELEARIARPRKAIGYGWWAAAAALLLLASTIGLLRYREQGALTANSPARPAALPTALGQQEVSASVEHAGVLPTGVAAGTPRKPVRKRSANPADTKTFLTLMEASFLPEPETLQVVRVELPPERLFQLGLATAVASRRVKAEVLVGDDGIARAVRVLGEE